MSEQAKRELQVMGYCFGCLEGPSSDEDPREVVRLIKEHLEEGCEGPAVIFMQVREEGR